MPSAPLLSEEDIAASLRELPGWERVGQSIAKAFELADFASAIAFVSDLVPVADELNHHPDVNIHWNRVELVLWTHASGGITERDFRLARAIEARVSADA